MDSTIVVVGGGPAGMMAAIQAAAYRARVVLVEKNARCGRKLLLTGNGRCNITNSCDTEVFIKHFSKNGQFLRDAFKHFFNQELIAFFEKRGLSFTVEDEGRVFPKTGRAESVLEILENELRNNNVELLYDTQVEAVLSKENGTFEVKLHDKETISCDAVILATGGLSYPSTGSTGDGFRIAEKLGHTIVALRPGLVALVLEDQQSALEGLTLSDVRLRFSNGKKKIDTAAGALLFTANGISGPLVLNASGQVVEWLAEGKRVNVFVDLLPRLTREEFEPWLLQTIAKNAKKTVKNMLGIFLPERLIEVFLSQANVVPEKRANDISQAERKKILDCGKAMRFSVVRSQPIESAMITRGGVSLKEVNPRTMESCLIKNLYCAGEILDVDADSGGFNLQAAFSTGYLAGTSAAS